MIEIRLPHPGQVAEIVEALLAHADVLEERAPELAAARRRLADELGDGLDALPAPTTEGPR